jgi:hypothetical protein
VLELRERENVKEKRGRKSVMVSNLLLSGESGLWGPRKWENGVSSKRNGQIR